MRGPRWEADEDAYLRDAYLRGASDRQIAFMTGRSEGSVYTRRIKLRLCSVREPRRKQERK